jgi:hypothetical protein
VISLTAKFSVEFTTKFFMHNKLVSSTQQLLRHWQWKSLQISFSGHEKGLYFESHSQNPVKGFEIW